MKITILLLSSLFIIGWMSDSFAQLRPEPQKLKAVGLDCIASTVELATFTPIPNISDQAKTPEEVLMEGPEYVYKALLYQPKPNPKTPQVIPGQRVVLSVIHKRSQELTRTFFDAKMGRGEIQTGSWDEETKQEVIRQSFKCSVKFQPITK